MSLTCTYGARECTGCSNCMTGGAETIGICEHCSDPITAGEEFYSIDGILLHEDCLSEFARENWRQTA